MICDAVKVAKAQVSNNKFKKLETAYGFSYRDTGLMGSDVYRELYRAHQHHLRDWMHILASDGICNNEIWAVHRALQDNMGVPIERVNDFSVLCVLPTA